MDIYVKYCSQGRGTSENILKEISIKRISDLMVNKILTIN